MKLLAVLAAATLIVSPALAGNQCRDAKGKFIKCPAAAAAPASNVTKDAKGKCHVASGPKKGAFTKCP